MFTILQTKQSTLKELQYTFFSLTHIQTFFETSHPKMKIVVDTYHKAETHE